MTLTAHDAAQDRNRELRECFGALLVAMREHRLPFPLAISADGLYSPLDPVRLRVQVDDIDFRRFYDLLDVSVVHSVDVDDSVHVHVDGKLRGSRVHLVAVMPNGTRFEQ